MLRERERAKRERERGVRERERGGGGRERHTQSRDTIRGFKRLTEVEKLSDG